MGTKSPQKKMTEEDKFARKYYCNPERFIWKMKRENNKKFRRLEKEIIKLEEVDDD